MALFDIVVGWSNESYSLGNPLGRQLKWSVLRKCMSSNGKDVEWESTRKSINELWLSEWHFGLRNYRNLAHQIFPQYELVGEFLLKDMADKPPDLVALRFNLLPIRNGQTKFDLFAQLKVYLENMRKFGREIFERKPA